MGDLGSAVDGVRGLDPVNLPTAELKTDLLRFTRHRSREDAVFAAWVLAAVRHQVGVEDGYVDTIGWLSWKTGSSRSELRRVVRLAELCELLPATGAAWRDGSDHHDRGRVDRRGTRCRTSTTSWSRSRASSSTAPGAVTTRRLRMLTQHFRNCARADGSQAGAAGRGDGRRRR